MARPIAFNRDAALNAALVLFWRQGYTVTSLNDLLSAMDIGRSSFYAAFGDKRSLFLKCLDLFAARTAAILDTGAKDGEPVKTIESFFEYTTFQVPRWRVEAGCMMVNSILELADVDDELSAHAADKLAEIEAAFARVFMGHVENPEGAASVVMTLNKGVRVSSRARASEQELRQVISSTLSLLRTAA